MGERRFLNLAGDKTLVKCIQKREREFGNSLSKGEIERNLRRLDKIMIPVIRSINIDKNHDPYKHGLEIVDTAQKIARLLGCSHDETILIGLAAYLHDIGKRSIDERILNKPFQLTYEEYKEVQKHVLFGELMVMPFTYISKLIRHHHERWDGRGYMDRLRGNKIPLGSRIIAVVDAYNAMTHKRAYDSKHGTAFAIHELKRCAGIAFDKEFTKNFRQEVLKNLAKGCDQDYYKQKLLQILCKKGEFRYERSSKSAIRRLEKEYLKTRLRYERQFDKAVVAAFMALKQNKNSRYIPKVRRFGYIEIRPRELL